MEKGIADTQLRKGVKWFFLLGGGEGVFLLPVAVFLCLFPSIP